MIVRPLIDHNFRLTAHWMKTKERRVVFILYERKLCQLSLWKVPSADGRIKEKKLCPSATFHKELSSLPSSLHRFIIITIRREESWMNRREGREGGLEVSTHQRKSYKFVIVILSSAKSLSRLQTISSSIIFYVVSSHAFLHRSQDRL